ncbi:hypothetical protein AAMO2058_001747300 [Amorphochlora amoebiformis]
MAASLTTRRRTELNKSIIGYLKSNGFDGAVQVLEKEMEVKYDKKYVGKLERKWTAVTKLSAKIVRLETMIETLQEDLKNFGRGNKKDASLALPRAPAKNICKGHKSPITCVIFHPVYSQVVTSSEDCTIKIWDYEEGQLEKTLKGHIDVVQHISFNQDGSRMASCSADYTIKVWNISAGQCTKTMRGHDHTVSCVEFTQAGDRLLSCSRDKSIKLWDVQTGYCLKTFEGHKEWVRQVKISPCTTIFASCSIDHTIRVWDYKKGEETMTFRNHKHVVDAIAFSHEKADQVLLKHLQNGSEGGEESKKEKSSSQTTTTTPYTPQFLASASRDKTVKIFHIPSGVMIANIIGHENWVRQVVFHPSGRYLLSCADDKTVRVWDLEKRFRCRKILEDAHDPFVTCIAWNQARPWLASGGVDNVLKIWECM